MNLSQNRLGSRVDMADSMVLTAIFLAAAYWGLEALINLFSPMRSASIARSSAQRRHDGNARYCALPVSDLRPHVQYTINNASGRSRH
jgi:hypothetical protein